MSETDNWIRLAMLESPRYAASIIEHFGDPDKIFGASIRSFMDIEGITSKTAERCLELANEPVDRLKEKLAKVNASVISIKDPDYPANLKNIPDPPAVLFVRGELKDEDRFSVAIIGTRKPSEYGRSMTHKMARDLCKRGLTVISGGARGIDTVAHRASIDSGGRTIAVLGCGIDVAYPYENKKLFEEIAESGVMISEYIPGTKPDAWRFPVRNRIVSGISMGVLVIESMLEGGAMITANVALDQNRDVWAMPGSANSQVSRGPHRLIKEGAKLVENADDILEELGLMKDDSEQEPVKLPSNLSAEQKTLIKILSLQPKHIDDIIIECNLSPASASSNLTLLEMMGLIRRTPGNSYVRVV